MKILVATKETQGKRKNDFCFCNAGDIVMFGILLCTNKNKAVVEMTLPENNKQLFASKYKLYLPTKEELIKQITSIENKE